MPQRTIVVIDDHEPFRRALRAVAAAADCVVAGEAHGPEDAVVLLGELGRPSLVMVDVNLGSESGIDLARTLVRSDPALRVVLVSTMDSVDLPADAAQAGTIGFVQKSRIDPELLRRLMHGPPTRESWHPHQDTR